MIGWRWLRAIVRGLVGWLAVLPALALAVAVLVDRGPAGEARFSFFPIALLSFDPFAWTCARNSLIFAAAVTAMSLIVGVGLGGMIAGPRRRVLRAAVASMLAAPPACLALGLLGTLGAPGDRSERLADVAAGGLSLESWSGWPLWLLWIWSGAPGAVALVAVATAAVRDRIDPAWRDAARLAGAGPIRIWRTVTWPMIRPAAARAAAVVFPMAMLEPGAPLILNLRRTLAFQIVEAATRPEPSPRAAVWTALAAALAIVGRRLLRRWGGPPRITTADEIRDGARPGMIRPGVPAAVASALIVAVAVAAGWLPIVGLIRLLARPAASGGSPAELIRLALAPPVPRILANSLVLGLGVAAIVMVLARVLRPDPGLRAVPTLGSRLAGPFALMPPMVQGVGLLALLALGGRAIPGPAGSNGPLAGLGELAPELAVDRNPRAILTIAVALSVGSRLLASWRRAAGRRPIEARSGLEAARLAGASAGRARAMAATRPLGGIGAVLLAAAMAAVNLVPALLFCPAMDVRTAGPAMLVLADGPDEARLQAAALAFCLIAGHLAGLGAARLAPAPPPEWSDDPP